MSVHYKFKAARDYDTLHLDGVSISLLDLKEAIIQQKNLGTGQKRSHKKGLAFDLKITNAETKEVYTDNILIQKNTSLIVSRIPVDPSQLKRTFNNGSDSTALLQSKNTEDAAEAAEVDRKMKEHTDLTNMPGTEEDKINAMIAQSTIDFHPSKYMKLRYSKMTGDVPKEYKCYKCHQYGHWVQNCPLQKINLRKSTGIPSMFLKEVEDATVPGAMVTAQGKFVVYIQQVDMEKHLDGKGKAPVNHPAPPAELICGLCKELLREAVSTPCCETAYCDECIREYILFKACPSCEDEGIHPEMLIPNIFLRSKCNDFDTNGFVQLSTPAANPISPLHHNSSSGNSIVEEEENKFDNKKDIQNEEYKDMKKDFIEEGLEENQEMLNISKEDKKDMEGDRDLKIDALELQDSQTQKHKATSVIPKFNPLVPPPSAYHKISPQYYYPSVSAQSMSYGESYMSYQPGVPPPSLHCHNSFYTDQIQVVVDPLAAFNKLMQERDIERESKRRLQRNQSYRAYSRRSERNVPPGHSQHSHERRLSRSRSRSPISHRMHPYDHQVYPSPYFYSHDPSLSPRRSQRPSVKHSHKRNRRCDRQSQDYYSFYY